MKTDTITTRRDFLKVTSISGAGLVLGFFVPALKSEDAPTSAVTFTPNAFIRIDDKGAITFISPKVEMGQGTYTAIPMLLAEELEVALEQVRVEHAPPDEARYADPLLGAQITGGSLAIRAFWEPLRRAGATAREMLIEAAANAWKVPPSSCRAAAGRVIHESTARSLSYGELATAAAAIAPPKHVALKDPKNFKLVGTAAKRTDSLPKIGGETVFGIDVRRPGMRVAVVAASPVYGGRLAGANDAAALAVKGVSEILRTESAIAVVAVDTWTAQQGLRALNPTWNGGPNASFSNESLEAAMFAVAGESGLTAQKKGDPEGIFAKATRRISASYRLPFLAHTAMEPLNCTVQIDSSGCDIWTGSQVPARARDAAATVTGLAPEQVRLHNQYLGGGFGRRLETDYVALAVSLARGTKGPIQFVWTREEDIRQEMPRPCFHNHCSAVLDEHGRPLAWSHRLIGGSVMGRWFPGYFKDGVDLDAVHCAVDLPYDIPNFLMQYRRFDPPMPTGNWRGVGPSHNIHVVESFIDELATAAGQDPVAYRLSLMGNAPRAKATLELVAEKSGWSGPLADWRHSGGRRGRGVSVQDAFGTFIALVAEVTVADSGEATIDRVVCAVDCGQVVNLDTVRAQLEGGVVYGASAVLWGALTYKDGRIQQSNFHDSRVMRIDECPRIEAHLIKSAEPPGGMGEVSTAALFPAVTNAVFAATGIRVRDLPISSAALRKVWLPHVLGGRRSSPAP